ncbi:hypothetical protein NUU61_007469 [Penicillium alfredii]|uniref:Uncharacterized protein n=1 Tax=Penicillium alfredii TaxID=1506179 RepID=A0A9W9F2Z5_9EURO|nr:uncharacterized protein NUU61_007469 [Penicillium alfredii]KAJ5092599.1 hypothetical protein NUU61_007469 [Penicillium alfredii]
MITSGIGADVDSAIDQDLKALVDTTTEQVTFDPALKDSLMLQTPGKELSDPEILKCSTRLNKPTPTAEFLDTNTKWLQYWNRYSHAVKVPFMYGISEFDVLLLSTQEALEKYRNAFPCSSRIECSMVPEAPHYIELSYQGRGWLARCCGFALECAG